MEEGSVINDETQVPLSESSNESEVEEPQVEETQSESQEEPEGQQQEQTQPEDSGETQYTEKGTKLDPNPLSAAHQQLANERKKVQQYQHVLNNPDTLKRYAQQMGLTLQEAKDEVKEAQRFSADKFQTADDVVEALNSVTSEIESIRQENEQLKAHLSGVVSNDQYRQVTTKLQTDVSTIRDKYPELDPKSNSYDAELEKELAELYHELDHDPNTGAYKGQVSMARLADRIMGAAQKARKQGSEDANTKVKQKQAGRVVTSKKTSSKKAPESKDPGTAIAQRIAQAMNQ